MLKFPWNEVLNDRIIFTNCDMRQVSLLFVSNNIWFILQQVLGVLFKPVAIPLLKVYVMILNHRVNCGGLDTNHQYRSELQWHR